MRYTRLGTLVPCLAILFAVSGRADDLLAQTIPSPYRFVTGVQEAGPIMGVVQDRRGYLGIGPGGGPLVGARYSRNVTGALAIDLSAYAISGERTVFQARDGLGLVPIGEATSRIVSVDARLRFTLTGERTWHGLAPYVVAGAGVAMNVSAQTELDQSVELSDRVDFGPSALIVAGGGTRWIPGERFVFSLEVVSHLWRQSTPSGFGDVEDFTVPLRSMDWIGLAGLVGGVSYRF